MPTASVLKLGLAYPMPRKLIEEFAAGVDTLYVIEDMVGSIADSRPIRKLPFSPAVS